MWYKKGELCLAYPAFEFQSLYSHRDLIPFAKQAKTTLPEAIMSYNDMDNSDSYGTSLFPSSS